MLKTFAQDEGAKEQVPLEAVHATKEAWQLVVRIEELMEQGRNSKRRKTQMGRDEEEKRRNVRW